MKFFKSEKVFIISFFILVIITGTIMLDLPISWNGNGRLQIIDAFFTATSAVCVTGLTSVDTAQFSFFGRLVIMMLIQIGGLGVITFTTIYLVIPGRISLKRTSTIQEFYVNAVESDPKRIIRQILLLTIIIELAGACLLFVQFRESVPDHAILFSVFHSVSAFCNAGFSLFSSNLEGYQQQPLLIYTVGSLVIVGGLGFVVIQDILNIVLRRKRKLSFHSRIVLFMTLVLVIGGTLFFFLIESHGSLAGYGIFDQISNSFFHAVTPRTAGFNIIRMQDVSPPSHILTVILMFIGGSSGSTAGGIKTTTAFLIILIILKGTNSGGSIRVFRRKIGTEAISSALSFAIRAIAILMVSVFLVVLFEIGNEPAKVTDIFKYIFECFSAFGTVGLSIGITPTLSVGGKIVIIMTMLAGRVGLMTIAIRNMDRYPEHMIDYPSEEVIIG